MNVQELHDKALKIIQLAISLFEPQQDNFTKLQQHIIAATSANQLMYETQCSRDTAIIAVCKAWGEIEAATMPCLKSSYFALSESTPFALVINMPAGKKQVVTLAKLIRCIASIDDTHTPVLH